MEVCTDPANILQITGQYGIGCDLAWCKKPWKGSPKRNGCVPGPKTSNWRGPFQREWFSFRFSDTISRSTLVRFSCCFASCASFGIICHRSPQKKCLSSFLVSALVLRKKTSQRRSLFALIGCRVAPGSHCWRRGACEECSIMQECSRRFPPHPYTPSKRAGKVSANLLALLVFLPADSAQTARRLRKV